MKRKILSALAMFLILVLASNGFGFAEANNEPVFVEEKGFIFIAPHDYDPFTSFVFAMNPLSRQ